MTFTQKLCVIEDHFMRMLIGVVEQRRGVYDFKEVQPEEVDVNKVPTCDLWHQRLRHPSKQVFIHCDIWGAYRVESLCGAHYFLSIVDDASSQ